MNRFRTAGFTGLAFIVLASGASAATVSFSYTVSGGAALTGAPAPGVPVGVLLFASSAAFTPFGNADYSEEGLITFQIFPSGTFAPIMVSNTFNASFNGGADTFFGTDEFLFRSPDPTGFQTTTSTMTILGGTGIFAGATGLARATGNNSPPPPDELSPVYFSGAGTDCVRGEAPSSPPL